GISESPGFAVLAEALQRHVGEAAARIMRAPFGLADANELAALVQNGGFRNVAIQQRVGRVCFPSVEKLVSSYIAGSPLAGPLSETSGASRAALTLDARNALRKYTSETELAFPMPPTYWALRARRVDKVGFDRKSKLASIPSGSVGLFFYARHG